MIVRVAKACKDSVSPAPVERHDRNDLGLMTGHRCYALTHKLKVIRHYKKLIDMAKETKTHTLNLLFIALTVIHLNTNDYFI